MTATEIQEELTALAAKFHAIVHGAFDAADVVTEGGNVPPLAKRLAALEALSQDYVTAAEAAKDAAETALGTLQEIIDPAISTITVDSEGYLCITSGVTTFKFAGVPA